MIASLAVNRPASSAVCLRRPFVCVLLSLLVNMLPVASQHSSKVARRWQFASRASYAFVCYAARPLVVPVTNRTLSVRPSVPRWRLTQGQKIRFSIQIYQIFRVAFLLGSTMLRSRDEGQVHQTRRNVPHLISGWPCNIFRKHVQKRGQREIHVPRVAVFMSVPLCYVVSCCRSKSLSLSEALYGNVAVHLIISCSIWSLQLGSVASSCPSVITRYVLTYLLRVPIIRHLLSYY